MSVERWATLRALLSGAASMQLWGELITCLGAWPAEERELAVDYVEQHLESDTHTWLPALRTVKCLDAPRWHDRLARHLELGWEGYPRYEQPAGTSLPAWLAEASHIHQLTLTGEDDFEQLLHMSEPLTFGALQLNCVNLATCVPLLHEFAQKYPGQLRSLGLFNSWTDASLEFVPPDGLQALSLVGVSAEPNSLHLVLPKSLQHLTCSAFEAGSLYKSILSVNKGSLRTLSRLTMHGADFDEELVALIAGLASLEELDLRFGRWEEGAAEALRTSGLCERVTSLWLGGGNLLRDQEDNALARCEALQDLDADELLRETRLAHYSCKEEGPAGGESALVTLYWSTHWRSLQCHVRWYGWWAGGESADSDNYELRGRCVPLDDTRWLVVPRDEGGHLSSWDPIDQSWPYLLFGPDRVCHVLHDQAPPNGNYEGPFNYRVECYQEITEDDDPDFSKL